MKQQPLFSIALIARNESKTLPHLIESLKEFKDRGGNILLLDTGSTDNTSQVAYDLGCKVVEVGDKFKHVITKELADKINGKFIVGEDPIVLKEGESYFDFASARNEAAKYAANDIVAFADADEVYATMNIDKVNEQIKGGASMFKYHFIFSHNKDGSPSKQFKQSKFYDRRKFKWVGIIHEILQPIEGKGGPTTYLEKGDFLLEHFQNVETNRSGYLRGLAVDCYEHPEKDRNSHYFAREMFYHHMYESAMKEFIRHIGMNGWKAEAAQSRLYVGDSLICLANIKRNKK